MENVTTPEEMAEDRMLDDMLEEYRLRRDLDPWIEREAERY
jgi:hypothetical protein